MQVGFIGLGTMGASMALNARAAGHDLTVHDIRPGAAAPLRTPTSVFYSPISFYPAP